jgi:hypothetical protein
MKKVNHSCQRSSLPLLLCLWPPNLYDRTLALTERGVQGLNESQRFKPFIRMIPPITKTQRKDLRGFSMKMFFWRHFELEELKSP